MTEVISVRFKNRGKPYFFAPGELKVESGQYVVVETSKGLACGECVQPNHFVTDERVKEPLQPVVRIATEADLRILEQNQEKEKSAFMLCKQKILDHKLDMKLVDVEYNFEGNKILFFFTSDGRVDFRDLVKDLASVFKTRIELRQIGVRDESRMLGGLGICGRPFCCSQFLDNFQSVSIKMAKTQSLSLNPTKISGACGRLMCCLRYEQTAYEDLVKRMPKHNAPVNTPDGPGVVTEVNLLRQRLKVRLENQQDIASYALEEVGLNGAPAPARVEKKPEFELEDELDRALSRLAGPSEAEKPARPKAPEHPPRDGGRQGAPRPSGDKRQGGQRQNSKNWDGQRQPRPAGEGPARQGPKPANANDGQTRQGSRQNQGQKPRGEQRPRSGNGQNRGPAPNAAAPKAEPAKQPRPQQELGAEPRPEVKRHRRPRHRHKPGGGQGPQSGGPAAQAES